MKKFATNMLWVFLAVAGAWAYATLALSRGEPINSAYILVAALCSYAIGYRFYSKWIATRVLALDDHRATPCVVHDDGKDFVKTNKWIVFGHHFAAIAGPGPLVGPVLASQFGYLPGTLWILIGVVLGGAVQDFIILFASMRRDGQSLGQMVKDELNTPAGFTALVAILAIMVIMLAVMALVVVKALAESPWGVFTVGATIPIALFMGNYLRFWRVGKVREASVIGVVGLLLAVWGGKLVYQSPHWSQFFGLRDITIAWILIGYGVISSSLPVWLLLAPRDYLSTFMKLGTIFALAVGILLVLPTLKMTALTRFIDGSGLVVAGKVFPFCFITIACGSISGFHTLIASGTTPKLITRESYARHIGYGAMCLESLVAIMALIAACTMEPGVYFSMNVKGDAASTAMKVTGMGFPITVGHMEEMAQRVGEHTLFGRTGGAATLAVGMAQIFGRFTHERWLDLWYHFAVMFEALFILTTVDAGTRVGRYLLQSILRRAWKPLGEPKNFFATPVAAALMVGAWGHFLIQGVRDPLGGVNSLWPLFGIANQMLAAIALCLATTIILKMQLLAESGVQSPKSKVGRPLLALVAFVPMVWLVAVTFAAGLEKVWDSDQRIGFLAAAKGFSAQYREVEFGLFKHNRWSSEMDAKARADMDRVRTLRNNNLLDAGVTIAFLGLVSIIVLISAREWFLLLSRRKPAQLRETPPVWLPDYAVAEGGRSFSGAAGAAALALALSKELSGEAQIERAQQAAQPCHCSRREHSEVAAATLRTGKTDEQIYIEMTEQRFKGVKRCC
jgi:carbon starvation protein